MPPKNKRSRMSTCQRGKERRRKKVAERVESWDVVAEWIDARKSLCYLYVLFTLLVLTYLSIIAYVRFLELFTLYRTVAFWYNLQKGGPIKGEWGTGAWAGIPARQISSTCARWMGNRTAMKWEFTWSSDSIPKILERRRKFTYYI